MIDLKTQVLFGRLSLPHVSGYGLATLALLLTASSSVRASDHRVLIIGVDGAGGRYIQQANTPAIDSLAQRGLGRFDFLNEGALVERPPEPYGASGVNWSTVLTGVSAQRHGVVDNTFRGSNFALHPHLFELAKLSDSTLRTASLVNWRPINTYITPDGFTDTEMAFNSGPIDARDRAVRDGAVQLLSTGDPDVVFLHFDLVDHAGHDYSWGSSEHLSAIETTDSHIGDVIAAIDARSGVLSAEEDWLVIVTADHGGVVGEFSHYASQGPANWEIPFIVAGPSVSSHTSLQQGTLRDVASTALWHLGVDPFALGLDGAIRGLVVPPPNGVVGDINQDGTVAGDGSGDAQSDDVAAFVQNWLSTGGGGIEQRYRRGDLNLDGITDLSDWALLTRVEPAIGAEISRRLLSQDVPEPSTVVMLALALAAAPTRPSRNYLT